MSRQQECTFNIAQQFSRFPGGRLRIHGPYSGEQFREEVLLPLLSSCEKLVIDMTGALGYGASFLDESFGEIGKVIGYEESLKRIHIVALDDPDISEIVWEKIRKGSEEGTR